VDAGVRIEQDAKTARAIYRDRKTRAYSKESADAVVCTVPLGVLRLLVEIT
jgi:hypothetical protein